MTHQHRRKHYCLVRGAILTGAFACILLAGQDVRSSSAQTHSTHGEHGVGYSTHHKHLNDAGRLRAPHDRPRSGNEPVPAPLAGILPILFSGLRHRFGLQRRSYRKRRTHERGRPDRRTSHAAVRHQSHRRQQAQWPRRGGAHQRSRPVRARPHHRFESGGSAGDRHQRSCTGIPNGPRWRLTRRDSKCGRENHDTQLDWHEYRRRREATVGQTRGTKHRTVG